jgi:pyruvate/2-oxoglutarate/acetoin dehydrogenase E1 component
MVEAINDAFHVELARDPSVMVIGEDVGRLGGVFRATAGLRDRFGPDRCVDTPLSEAGVLGAAVGLCMAGWRPVVEMQYDAFSYPCLDQLITHVGRYRWRTGGAMGFPLVIRMPYGGGVRAPELHDDSPESYYVHTPGVKLAVPATPADAKGLLKAAIRTEDPVVFLENELLYGQHFDVPQMDGYVLPIGKARIVRPGKDVTIVSYSIGVGVALEAAQELMGQGINAEVIDLRTLRPLDKATVLESLKRTNRMVVVEEGWPVCSISSEIIAIAMTDGFDDLDAPVLRVTDEDVPLPYAANLEKLALIKASDVVEAVKAVTYR